MEHVLIKERKFSGYYVTVEDYNKTTIISYGEDPQKVYEEAIKKGYTEPLIVFIPSKDMVQIYCNRY